MASGASLHERQVRLARGMAAARALLAGAALLPALLLCGCLDDDMFLIVQNQVPQSGCQLTTTTTIYNPRGTLDVALNWGYWLYPLLENNMTSTKSKDGEPERNNLSMRGFNVTLDMSRIPGSFPEDLTDFFEPVSGAISPGGLAASRVKIIPDRLVPMLANLVKGRQEYVVATVTAVALHQGSELESTDLVFPVDLCYLCLVDLRSSCPSSDDKTIQTNYCGLPQDSKVTCCNDPVKGYKCYTSTTSGSSS